MVDATKYFGGNFIKASDITDPQKLTIKDVKEVEIDEKQKLEVHFEETDKVLVLNKINTNRIISWAGSKDTNDWPGTTITLLKGLVEYDGKDVPCVRVKKKQED